MSAGREGIGQPALDAVADFRQAAGMDEIWAQLHRHMAGFGITGVMYGFEAVSMVGKPHDLLLCSYDSSYMDAKRSADLLDCDEFVRMAKVETAPILWGRVTVTELERLPPLARRAIDLDWEYGILTGVTLPLRFNGSLGRAGFGLHAAHMTWAEFERVWQERGPAIQAIATAFDVRLRADHLDEVFPLTPRERECLLWVIEGLRPQRIAHRLGTHVKTVEKQLDSARRKLGATTVAQAVATALVHGLVTPGGSSGHRPHRGRPSTPAWRQAALGPGAAPER